MHGRMRPPGHEVAAGTGNRAYIGAYVTLFHIRVSAVSPERRPARRVGLARDPPSALQTAHRISRPANTQQQEQPLPLYPLRNSFRAWFLHLSSVTYFLKSIERDTD